MTTAVASPDSRSPAQRARWLPAAIIFLGATAIAMMMSPTVSIWTDEAVTISAADRSLGQLWALIQRIDAVHATYYAGMSLWVDLFGQSPWALRVPSALAAGGTAVGVYFVARQVATERTALVASVVAATLPRLTWGGIEARPFIFAALASVWASYLLLKALSDDRARLWVAYGAIATIGVAVNIYLALVIVAHGLTVLLHSGRDRRRVAAFAITAVAVAVITSPLLLLARSQQAQLGGNGDRNPLSILRKMLINQFFLGETPDLDAANPSLTRAWQAAAIAAACLGIALMLVAILRPLAPGDDKRNLLALVAPGILVPTTLVAGYAVLVAPLYQPRYLTFTAPAAALLIAAGLRAIRGRWLKIVAIVLYVACIAVVFVSQRTPFAKSGSDWSAVAGVMESQSETGDAIYFAPRYDTEGEYVEMTARRIAEAYPTSFEKLTDLTLIRTGAETATLDGYSARLEDIVDLVESESRVWMLMNTKTPSAVFESSEEIFERLGFTGRVVWDGPSTVVVEYVSSP